jgi:hypothetical protein
VLVDGPGWNGLFDADLRRLGPDESVTVTATASVPGQHDPDPSDNTDSVVLTHHGLISGLLPQL